MTDSIRDDIEAAFNSANGKEGDEIDNTSVIDALEPKDEEVVDNVPEAAKPEGEDTTPTDAPPTKAETKEPAAGAEPEGTWDPEKAPTSWSPKIREKWASLDPEVRKEIVRREEANVVGVRKLQEEFQPIRQFAENLGPFIQEARQLGADPGQYMHNVMTAERNLRSQDPNQKFNALLDIADTYGIPIRQYLGVEKQAPAAPAIPPALQQELASMRQWRESQEQQTLIQQIDTFRKDKEFFDDVRDRMADLMDSGAAKTLEEAYETAIWANPEIRSVLLTRQEQERSKSKLNERQAAAATASVRGSGSEVTVDTDDDDSIEAIIRRAASENSGRL